MPTAETTEKKNLVTVEIMGKKYQVPQGITLIQAMWHTGHQITRGIGCLGGVCGACSTLYRTKGSYELKQGLGCQLIVEEGMSFSLSASFPVQKPIYRMEEITDPKQDLFKYFPEVALCRNCNACTEACPQGIDVRTGIWKAAFGDFKEASNLFLSCVMCSLCVPVCIAEISSNQVGLYVRRAEGIFFNERPPQLSSRIEEIHCGKYNTQWETLMKMSEEELKTCPIA
ncbi:MAG: 2Fe-2S iron-sulfur cluster-binding protein [Candidatus Manganitrophus sp. SB1]|nr:2Fe-2S iron-sulfur cluster-binding protein [Candidatus Manganitrophus morganii]